MRYQFNHLIRCLVTIFLMGTLVACSTVRTYQPNSQFQPQELFDDELIGDPISLLKKEDIYQLTEKQKEEIKTLFLSNEYRRLSPSRQIFKFLQSQLPYFNFHSDTYIAKNSLSQNAGNCLSLAILTKALTQMSNVGIQYELAKTPGVFQRENGFLLNSQHIRTVIYDKAVLYTPRFSSKDLKIKIDYFSTAGSRTLRKVNKDEFQAMFYSNRAAELIIDGKLTDAYWHLKEAIRQDADNLVAINMLGVLYERLGHTAQAERAFVHGLSFGHDQLELLNNYHKLLVKDGQSTKAATVASILADYDDPDPFKWIDLGDKELAEKNYQRAITYYEKAAAKAEYLHQPFAGLAKANFFLGRNGHAIKAIRKAIENTHNGQMVSVYQTKYDVMKAKGNSHN